jgi:hypothetical protein
MQMKLDFLFRRNGAERLWSRDQEPVIEPMSMADNPRGTPATPPPRQAPTGARRSLALLPPRLNEGQERYMSPRQLAQWAHEMYVCGALTWPEYRLAGFHAELHPHYNATVGALTGRIAAPDHPRDMVREWRELVAFFHRHNDPHDPQVKHVEKVLALLCRQDPILEAGTA